MNNSTLMLCRGGILSAVILVLSMVENMIPELSFALPGMKLGISNVAVMLALEMCPLPLVLCIGGVKALFAFVTRGVTAFFMSMCGTILSVLVMWCMVRIRKLQFGCFGLGVAGAFAHNAGQLMVACALMGRACIAYGTVLCIASVATGAITGLLYYIVMPPLRKVPLFGTSR